MKTKLFFSAIFLIAFILGGCQKSNDVLQEDDYSTLKKKPVERPFKITGHTVPGGGPGGEECGPDANGIYGETDDYQGVGNASHMGRITYSGTNCRMPYGCLNSEITVVAANGDELYMFNTDYSICVTDYNPPFITFEGPGFILGGTGRFEGATGDVYWIIIWNVEVGATIEVEGTITY